LAAWSASSLADKQPPSDDEGWLSARIEAVEPSGYVRLLPTGDNTPLRVRITRETEVNRDGPADIEAFSPGDLVAIRLTANAGGNEVVAEKVHAFYHDLGDVRIVARNGQRFDTDHGAIVLNGRSEVPDRYGQGGTRVPAKRLDEIGAGDRASVQGRYETREQAFVAHYVRAE
jgi:hypothetical protein